MRSRAEQLVIVVIACLLAAVLGKLWSIERALRDAEAAIVSCSR